MTHALCWVCVQVAAASRRILALQQLLGGGDVDVVWMLVREPRLLSADFRRYAALAALTSRLHRFLHALPAGTWGAVL